MIAAAGVWATSALAYPESSTNPSGLPYTGNCTGCHGATSSSQASNTVNSDGVLTSGSESGYNVGTRKGPHAGYTPGTQKCQTCHVIHGAASNFALLKEQTVLDTCNTCHDGTGGGGVYGVVKARTGVDPGAQHRVGIATGAGGVDMIVPGGDSSGAATTTAFSGVNGDLTCTDCHTPHNANTVAPFAGDRRRSITDTTTYTTATNRLLKQRPTSATSTSTEYGSDWCEACHKGRHGLSTLGNHPVTYQASGYYYRKVEVLSGYNTTTRSAVATNLGGSNLGYVMPEPRGSQQYPICQQCHEDSRNVGDVVQFQVSSATESFTVSADGSDSTSNPRFQNFPHETQNASFLIEQWDDLCLNCHTAPGG